MSSVTDFLSTPLPPIAISLSVILAILVIISHARRLGTEDKKRYHPVVTTFLNVLINFSRLHDYMTELACKHKTYSPLSTPKLTPRQSQRTVMQRTKSSLLC
ncbi:unnamed protein product [Prunus brigantina]